MKFTIITCTHNPDTTILIRLITAISNLKTEENTDFEWIIVDNNSTPPIHEIPFITETLKKNTHFILIKEVKPGLTNARIAGIKESKHDWIVFFDDDNEPQEDYLIKASFIIKKYPHVGCWGPGNISVEFLNKKIATQEFHKLYFQERHVVGEIFSNNTHWQGHYPQGTGLVIKKEILYCYMQYVESGQYNLKDREGKSLSSAGDVQIVLTGIKQGFSAGISETLSLSHLIQSSRVSFKYLSKLCYGTASSYIKAYNEVNPEDSIPVTIPSNIDIFKQIYFWIRINKWGIMKQEVLLRFVSRLGEFNAQCLAANCRKKPLLIMFFDLLFT